MGMDWIRQLVMEINFYANLIKIKINDKYIELNFDEDKYILILCHITKQIDMMKMNEIE